MRIGLNTRAAIAAMLAAAAHMQIITQTVKIAPPSPVPPRGRGKAQWKQETQRGKRK